MSAEELYQSNLDVIENAAHFVARRARLSPADADDLASRLHIRLMENDYAVLRKFEGRCSLATYVGSIAWRLLVDDWMHTHGRWRSSAEAKRLGSPAILLESLLHREHATLEEATVIVMRSHQHLTREEILDIAAHLPPRGPRPRLVALEDEIEPAIAGDTVEAQAIAHEKAAQAEKVSSIFRVVFQGISEQDRVAVRLRFAQDMSVAGISRMQQRDQKQLYRRLEQIYKLLAEALQREGFTADDIRGLIGEIDSHLDFGFRDGENGGSRQAMHVRGIGSNEVPE